MFSTSDWITLLGIAATCFIGMMTSVWTMRGWLSKEFNSIKTMVYEVAEKTEKSLINKLEYHERHDDQRFMETSQNFNRINNDIWEIKLRHAALDNTKKPSV